MSTTLGLRPVCEASPPMTAAAIVHNLDLAWLEEELFHHTRIAKDSLEGLHRRFAARVEIFAPVSVHLEPESGKVGLPAPHPTLQTSDVEAFFHRRGGVFALTIKDKILVEAW